MHERHEDRPDDEHHEHHHEEHDHHHEDRHEPKITSICLVKTKGENVDDVFIDTFKCCQEEDEPESCLHNSTYPGSHRGHRDDNTLFDTVLSPKAAAVCKSINLRTPCPDILTQTGAFCIAFQTNCTLFKPSKECGCPGEEDSITLTGTTYGYSIPAMTCKLRPEGLEKKQQLQKRLGSQGKIKATGKEAGQAAKYERYEPEHPTNPVYVGVGFKIQGTMSGVVGRGYYGKEVKGTLEVVDGFTPQLDANLNNVVAPNPLPDLPLITSGLMKIRLVEDEHY